MKRPAAFFLCLMLLLGLTACGSSAKQPAANSTAAPVPALRVGYARVVITPKSPINLEGYGTTRMHTAVLDNIFLTCLAITDSQDNTLLMLSADAMAVFDYVADPLMAKLSQEFGIPLENISISATHTHSAPSVGNSMNAILTNAIVPLVQEALDDRKPAQMFYGTATTHGLNFVRHYRMNDGSFAGDNFGSWSSGIAGHTTEADGEMRIVQFQRQGGKEVVLANWQAHPTLTGGSAKLELSADYVGAWRTYLEKERDCQFVYFQGAAGNINCYSYITAETVNNPDRSYSVHGKALTKTALQALENTVPLESGPIKVATLDFTAACDHSDAHMLADAEKIMDFYKNGKTLEEATSLAKSMGFNSYHHTTYVVARSKRGDSETVPIRACSVGELSYIVAPYEMFDTNGMYIRQNSPFKATLILGYSNNYLNYIASEAAYDHGCYEVDTRRYVKGTAEQLAEEFVKLLNSLQ